MGYERWDIAATTALQRYCLWRGLVAAREPARLLLVRWHNLSMEHDHGPDRAYPHRTRGSRLDCRFLCRWSSAGIRLGGWLFKVMGCLPGPLIAEYQPPQRNLRRCLWRVRTARQQRRGWSGSRLENGSRRWMRLGSRFDVKS